MNILVVYTGCILIDLFKSLIYVLIFAFDTSLALSFIEFVKLEKGLMAGLKSKDFNMN